ncbi:MAG: helix-turn-helix domain-containing protein [Candidatus Helarchaeota archaeon]|nr:helix-turn-helix domain-containing protein [Candidatus Helarchaeota archaeon]
MIKNELQYRITKTQVKKFITQLNQLKTKEDDLDPILFQAEKDAIESQLEEMQKELEEYEQLQRSKSPPLLELRSIEELPRALIKARIALGLTQKDLAGLIGVKEQQIQRWEAIEYSTTNLTRIKEIIKILNIVTLKNVHLPRESVSLSDFFKKMKDVGLDQKFIVKRLLPPLLASRFEDQDKRIAPDLLVLQASALIGKIFHWTPEEILSDTPLQLNTALIPEIRFKLPKRRNELQVNAYTVYSHYIALLVAQATEHLAPKSLPTDPYEIYHTIQSQYGALKIENVVRYIWELGVPIIALSDPGAFHAVCFQIQNRNIIILKQKTLSEARWMFDLLHEFWHATQKRGHIVHLTPESGYISGNSEDITASQFAAAALLGKNPQILAEKCMQESYNDARRMKRAIYSIARKEGVRTDVLANYIAFRLYLEGDNSIWGIAESLQEKSRIDSRIIIKNIFLEYADLGALSAPDLELLRKALIYEGE